MNSLLEALIAAKLSGSGGGGGAAVLYTQQTLTAAQQAQARANIGAVSLDEIGTVFTLKGGVATVEDLPASGNNVGDVYYVEAVSAGYIWLTSASQPNGYWEELGETFDVTVDSELSPTSENPVQNKVIAAALENKADKEATITVSGTTPTITPINNRIYNCGEVTSLTISNPTATGAYSIVFTSGSTATDLSIPPELKMPDGFSVEANRLYEINVLANRATIGSWAVSV